MNTVTLSNGVEIPQIGYGTWIIDNDEKGVKAVVTALTHGYSHIDAAAAYGNEQIVGKGIKESGVERSKIFVTSKVWNSEHGYDKTIAACNKTLKDLDLEYLDLYLIHWPAPHDEGEGYVQSLQETWRALEDLYKEGKVRAIGVSNCKIHHLEEIAQTSTITPMVNQIEYHPSSIHPELVAYCRDRDIAIEGYSIYGHGEAFKSKELQAFADKYNVNIGKICLQYALQKGVIALVKSMNSERIIDNIQLDFTLSDDDMAAIDAITTTGGIYRDSDNIPF